MHTSWPFAIEAEGEREREREGWSLPSCTEFARPLIGLLVVVNVLSLAGPLAQCDWAGAFEA